MSFLAWATKAMVLDALGRSAESADVMKKAFPFGQMGELHQYARQLIAQKKSRQAFDVFKLNYDKHPNLYALI